MKKNLSILFLFLSSCTSLVSKETKSVATFPVEEAIYAKNWDERKISALSVYETKGLCGGLPKINVKTAPGFCVGLVDNGEGMVFPRTGAQVSKNQILVVDMGGWKESNGKLYLLNTEGGKIVRKTILDAATSKNPLVKKALDRPHLIMKGPDGKFYLSSTSMIVTLDPLSNPVENSFKVVIDQIPNLGLHPLKVFTFDNDLNLYVNVGSATNVCQKQGSIFENKSECSEAEDLNKGQAQVRKYLRNSDGSYNPQFVVYAKGLRNSMGLIWDKRKNILIQAENSRDNIAEYDKSLDNVNLPHEELNLLNEGDHFGWPYCYDSNLTNPEWKNSNCSNYKAPHKLMPAHSSPLSLMEYSGALFPKWYQGRMLISLHGYEPRGHRIVAYLRDDNGLPTREPLSIVYGWDAKGNQAKGSPVGLSQLEDGSVLIIEDKSRKVLRLFYDSKLGDGKPVAEIPEYIAPPQQNKDELLKQKLEKALAEKNPPLFAQIQKNMIDRHCSGCHVGADARGLELALYDFEGNEKRIIENKKEKQILYHLRSEKSFAQMPPDGFPTIQEKDSLVRLYIQWLQSKGIDSL